MPRRLAAAFAAHWQCQTQSVHCPARGRAASGTSSSLTAGVACHESVSDSENFRSSESSLKKLRDLPGPGTGTLTVTQSRDDHGTVTSHESPCPEPA